MTKPTRDPVPVDREGFPRWAIVLGTVVAVLILLVVVMMVAGGGHQIPDHGMGTSGAPVATELAS